MFFEYSNAIKKEKPAIVCELFSKFANYKNIFDLIINMNVFRII